MAFLQFKPYQYVPTKPRPVNHPPSCVDKQSGSQRTDQQGVLAVVPQKTSYLSTGRVIHEACTFGEMSMHSSVNEPTTGERAKLKTQRPTNRPSAEASSDIGIGALHQGGLGREIGNLLPESDALDLDPPGDVDSLFGNIRIENFLEECEVKLAMDDYESYAIGLHSQLPADATDTSAMWDWSANSDSQPRPISPRIEKGRRPSQDDLPVILNSDSRSGEGALSDVRSDVSSHESIFEASWQDRSPASSLSDVVPKSAECLDILDPEIITHPAEHERSISIETDGSFDSVQEGHAKISGSGFLTDDSEDELSHPPEWYRFGASTSMVKSLDDNEAGSEPVGFMQVEDAYRQREFHDIIGMERIDGEDYCMLDWVPTLVRRNVLRNAQVLIARFEARCRGQKEKRKWDGDTSQMGDCEALRQTERLSETSREMPPRKPRGRPRKFARQTESANWNNRSVGNPNSPARAKKALGGKTIKPVPTSGDQFPNALRTTVRTKPLGRPRKPVES